MRIATVMQKIYEFSKLFLNIVPWRYLHQSMNPRLCDFRVLSAWGKCLPWIKIFEGADDIVGINSGAWIVKKFLPLGPKIRGPQAPRPWFAYGLWKGEDRAQLLHHLTISKSLAFIVGNGLLSVYSIKFTLPLCVLRGFERALRHAFLTWKSYSYLKLTTVIFKNTSIRIY